MIKGSNKAYEAYEQVAKPSMGSSMKQADDCDDALGKNHPFQRQTEFEAKPVAKAAYDACSKQIGRAATDADTTERTLRNTPGSCE